MAEDSNISWTDNTFNPWLGCQRISPACGHCYAERLVTTRMSLPLWGPPKTTERHRTAVSNWRKPLAWNRKAQKEGHRLKVFCASLADVFEDAPQVAPWRADLFRMIEDTPALDWLLLTKRPEHMVRLAAEAGWTGVWPGNVWAGTTVESQDYADERIPHLLSVPARVRFLSVEPLLSPVNLRDTPCNVTSLNGELDDYFDPLAGRGLELQDEGYSEGVYPRLSWVIVGGESGPGARPFDLEWARSIRDQCKATGTAFFMKQAGANAVDSSAVDIIGPDGKARYRRAVGHPDIDEAVATPGYTVQPAALRFKDKAGADPDEWPEDLRVQEWPTV